MGLKVLQVWEHTLDNELKKDKDLKQWFDNEHDTGALDPRDAFFGGRVHPTRMICAATTSTNL